MPSILRPLLLALLATGCESVGGGSSCTLLGCVDGLSIDFTRTAWPDGAYSVKVRMDGKDEALCTALLPFEPSGTSGICNAKEVTLGTSGQQLPKAQQALTGLRVNGTPLHVAIELRRNGQIELSTEVTPTYLTTNPNGPACGPTCTQGSVKVAVP